MKFQLEKMMNQTPRHEELKEITVKWLSNTERLGCNGHGRILQHELDQLWAGYAVVLFSTADVIGQEFVGAIDQLSHIIANELAICMYVNGLEIGEWKTGCCRHEGVQTTEV